MSSAASATPAKAFPEPALLGLVRVAFLLKRKTAGGARSEHAFGVGVSPPPRVTVGKQEHMR
jgi:hypothetical protein